jgi:hypothetical protein
MNPESDLDKALAGFISNELQDVLFGCLIVISLALLLGCGLGICHLENKFILETEKLKVDKVRLTLSEYLDEGIRK